VRPVGEKGVSTYKKNKKSKLEACAAGEGGRIIMKRQNEAYVGDGGAGGGLDSPGGWRGRTKLGRHESWVRNQRKKRGGIVLLWDKNTRMKKEIQTSKREDRSPLQGEKTERG